MESKSRELATEYFHGALKAAIKNQGVAASEPTECYLVGLLAEHLKGPLDDEPLALKLASAVVSSPDERLRHLKELGDNSLYVSGFFSDSLQRKLVDIGYYIQIGGAGYRELARHFRGGVRRSGGVFGDIYDELGSNFSQFVDVLAEVSEQSALTT